MIAVGGGVPLLPETLPKVVDKDNLLRTVRREDEDWVVVCGGFNPDVLVLVAWQGVSSLLWVKETLSRRLKREMSEVLSCGSMLRIATTRSANRSIPEVTPQAPKFPTTSDATVSGRAGVELKVGLFQTTIMLVLGKSLICGRGDQQTGGWSLGQRMRSGNLAGRRGTLDCQNGVDAELDICKVDLVKAVGYELSDTND